MSKSRAIRLDGGGGAAAAIGLHEVIEVVTEGDIAAVPMAPRHCHELLQWRDQWIPVFDLAAWCGLQAESVGQFFVVVGYPADGGGVRYGCMRVPAFPKIVELSDQQACSLPDDADWGRIAISCFKGEGKTVPILSLRKVFELHEAGAAQTGGQSRAEAA
jgi:chemotaxis signal transduction protein